MDQGVDGDTQPHPCRMALISLRVVVAMLLACCAAASA